MKRLYRSKKDRIFADVCGGVGKYFGIDPVLIRLIWALVSLFSMGLGIVGYIIAWIVVPEEPQ